MNDPIDRQAATQTALEFIVEYLGGAFDEDFQRKLIERMNALPSAQPLTAYVIRDEYGNIACSNCGSPNCWGNYCMNCGAKMGR